MKEKIILASNSPRRSELLKSCDINFEVISHKFDESSLNLKNPVKFAEVSSFSKAKSLSVLPELSGRYILGVDTIVVYKDKILGKPADKNEARKFVNMMSGGSNTVISGITLMNQRKNISITRHSKSKVSFQRFSDSFIKYYLDNNHFEGYAGGYAIQGIFSLVINKITGSYTNIVGLPMEILYEMLTDLELYP